MSAVGLFGRALAVPARLIAAVVALAGWRGWLVMFAAGLAAAAALPPIYALPGLFAYALLVARLDRARSPVSAALSGWAFAFGYHIAGLYWISNALLVDGDRFAWLVPFAAAGLPAGLALFGALAGAAYRMLRPTGWLRVPAFAAIWGLAEWLRGHIATGFPWNLPASSWAFSDALLQPLALLGGYGYSLFVLAFAAAPVLLAVPRFAEAAEAASARRRRIAAGLAFLTVPLMFAGFGFVRLAAAPTPDPGAPVVRVVQGNVAQQHKWKRELLEANLARYLAMTEQREATARPDGSSDLPPPAIVVWPETAVPFFLNLDVRLRQLLGEALAPGAVLFAGAPVREAGPRGEADPKVFNSLLAIATDGTLLGRYDKSHLVPFGEYVPFRAWLPLTPIVKTFRDFTAGPGLATLAIPGLPAVGPLICYEVIFPGAVAAGGAARPDLLVNVTNDAWFGVSNGPYQHLVAARMRAVEEGLPLIRAANTGISAVIDPFGRVLVSLGLGHTGVLDSRLPAPLGAATVYARAGETPLAAWVVLTLLLVLVGRWRRT